MTREAARVSGRGSIRRRCIVTVVAVAVAGVCPGLLAGASASVARTRAAAAGRAASAGTWGTAEEVPGLAALNTGGDANLDSVSCRSPGDCSAGGFYSDSSGPQVFVVSEKNGTWGTAAEVPGTAALNAGEYAELGEVSCGSPGNCGAGGFYSDASGYGQAFVVSETNGTWGTAAEVRGTAALNQGGFAAVSSASCASAGNCSAGGEYRQASLHYQAFVVSEKNGTWGTAQHVPGLAALNTGGDAEIISVSCATASNCSAGGVYADSSGTQAFVVSEMNGTWGTAEEVPGTAALNTGGFAVVNSVSCGSPGNCSAGGGYADTSGNVQAFVVSEKNGTWGTARNAAPVSPAGGEVYSVSCASAGNCTAGGYYRGSAFGVNEKHGAWGAAEPVSGAGRGSAGIDSVSCASAGNCSAGGQGGVGPPGAGFERHAFVVSQAGGTLGPAKLVPGLAAFNHGKFAAVSSVSCASPGNCSAGGYYKEARHGSSQAFVVGETNGNR